MGKQVDRIEFWRQRIQQYPEERQSVYLTGIDDWRYLNAEHEKIFEKEIRSTDKVLDAGCGYGRWSRHFNDYVGVDFSPDFIKMAKERFPEKKFLQADLKDLPFVNKEFDVAFCVSMRAMVVGNLGQEIWDSMEKELKRVAKKVLILEYSSPQDYWIL